MRKQIEEVLLAVENMLFQQQVYNQPLRLSSAGSCARKMAYQIHFPDEGEPISSRGMSVFALGHLLHNSERDNIKQVAKLTREEEEVKLEIDIGSSTTPAPSIQKLVSNGKLVVVGHIDGVLETSEGPALLDIKTTSTRSFNEKIRTGPGYEYTAQLNAYMEATGIKNAWLWLYNKETSHRAVIEVPYDQKIVDEIKQRFTNVALSTPDKLPEREYQPKDELSKGEPTGNQYLPWQCTYCPFTAKCWAEEGFKIVFSKGKPRWVRSVK